MKFPKVTRRHCPSCKAHTEHKVSISKKRGRGQTRPLSRDSTKRVRLRGERRGVGNHGKRSKPPVGKWKRVGKKLSQKTDFRYLCTVCKKTHCQKTGLRTRKVELI